MIYLLYAVCAVAAGYQLVALMASLRHWWGRDPVTTTAPGVTIVKPIHGLDAGLLEALRSNAHQDYPEFELLCGVASEEDPALPGLRALEREFPSRVRVFVIPTEAPNRKAGVMAGLERQARYPVVIAADADIAVPRDYLRRVVAPLQNPSIGLVTCIYRARAGGFWGAFESLGIATDFAPSALVAPFVGIREFGLGSTLALRAMDLKRMGGFASVEEYLADDYQIGKQTTQLGLRVWMSKVVVETSLDAHTWTEMWRHQVRWSRTVRVSRGDGYVGLPVTFATFWALVALLAGEWPVAAGLLAIRMAMAWVAAFGVLRCPVTARWWMLIPLRDLVSAAVWVAGMAGRGVEWRGQQLEISSDGRILTR